MFKKIYIVSWGNIHPEVAYFEDVKEYNDFLQHLKDHCCSYATTEAIIDEDRDSTKR